MWAKFKNLKGHLVLVVFSILVLMQLQPFLDGYRLTADDVAFHYYSMSGWEASWEFIKGASIGQGRIVHFVDLPFSLLGSHYADNYLFRVFYTLLYFFNFLLIGVWASLFYSSALSKNIVFFVAVVLISFHPLDYFHLAPNAYPFHVSLPIFIILTARVGLWYLRRDAIVQSSKREYLLLFLFFGGLIFSEYGFLFGASLVSAEYLFRVVRLSSDGVNIWRAFILCLRHKYFLRDASALLVFLALYLGFRLAFPSAYDGNKISSDLDFVLFAKTFIGHIYGGTSIASFVRYDALLLDQIRNLGLKDASLILFIFISTFYVSKHCLNEFLLSDKPWVSNKIAIAVSGLLIAIFITTPVALTAKYQGWCTDISSCIFLDSRVSYLGVGLFVSFLVFAGLIVRRSFGSRIIIILSLFIAGVGAFSFLNNKRIALDMGDYSSAWDRAKLIACVTDSNLLSIPVPRIVDPRMRLSYHPSFDVENYWLKYLDEHKQYCKFPAKLDQLFPSITYGRAMHFHSGSDALTYLISGWSGSESWGVWSDSRASTIFLPITPTRVDSVSLDFNALVSTSHPTQRLEVLVNGIRAYSGSIRDSSGVLEFKLPDAAKSDSFSAIKMEFRMPDAARPMDVGLGDDGRTLALGLRAITLR